jgi:hypothetical protein
MAYSTYSAGLGQQHIGIEAFGENPGRAMAQVGPYIAPPVDMISMSCLVESYRKMNSL